MPTRQDVVAKAESFLGYLSGQGFDQPNQFSTDLGLPGEAWCGDFVTDVFKLSGIALPSMQVGHPTGFSYCPDAAHYAEAHGCARPSWEAVPGDIILFDWHGKGVAEHTGLVAGTSPGMIHAVSGNSGPRGGVNPADWNCPPNVGNNLILMTINADALVSFGGPPVPGPAPIPKPGTSTGTPPWPGRVLVLKTPDMTGDDVRTWQQRMSDRGWAISVDGDYGAKSRDICVAIQQQGNLTVDGQVGPQTWDYCMRSDNVTP
jgi:hypothetical protein